MQEIIFNNVIFSGPVPAQEEATFLLSVRGVRVRISLMVGPQYSL
jgi:hypothetical protein